LVTRNLLPRSSMQRSEYLPHIVDFRLENSPYLGVTGAACNTGTTCSHAFLQVYDVRGVVNQKKASQLSIFSPFPFAAPSRISGTTNQMEAIPACRSFRYLYLIIPNMNY
jgi:hypothetical protein